jgi:L-ascorbate metabolism protein UlaG (beta-lactamase superfamily)
MEHEEWYLKPNVVLEPLFDRWYAWAHLISPATAAMNIKNRHLKILNSYIQSPQIHVEAVKNPKMRGGPFVDFEGIRVEEARKLRSSTLEKQSDMLALADAIAELNKMLKTSATGFSMESLYARVPELLKGYVELVYDLNNNPSFRFFERLLYTSKFYSENSQSMALWVTNNDERPFVLSTPKLDDPHVLHLEIPFRHHAIDLLSKMRRFPGSVGQIAEALSIPSKDRELFNTFFTRQPPQSYVAYEGDKIRMRYFGHACILVETKEVSILVDPVISYHGYSSDVSRYSEANLPEKIDFVLITHNHQDHIMLETLLALRHKIGKIIVPRSGNGALQDPSIKLMLNAIGFNNVVELDEFETVEYLNCKISGLPFMGEHSDLNIRAKLCHHIKIGSYSLLFAADSCNIEPKLYNHVFQITGPVDSVFLGMECDGAPLSWLYGPLLTENLPRDMDNSRRLAGSNFERGKALVDVFKPRELYVYAMGMEPWLEFISSIKYTDESRPIVQSNLLIQECRKENITAERLFGEKEMFYAMETVKL